MIPLHLLSKIVPKTNPQKDNRRAEEGEGGLVVTEQKKRKCHHRQHREPIVLG